MEVLVDATFQNRIKSPFDSVSADASPARCYAIVLENLAEMLADHEGPPFFVRRGIAPPDADILVVAGRIAIFGLSVVGVVVIRQSGAHTPVSVLISAVYAGRNDPRTRTARMLRRIAVRIVVRRKRDIRMERDSLADVYTLLILLG